MATHSSILAWRILWAEEPGGLLSIGWHRGRRYWSNLACMHALEKEMVTHSSVLAWRIPGREEPGGLPSMGLHRVGHDWSDLAAAAYKWSEVKVAQLCLTLCDPMIYTVHGILQARILKWVAFPFSRGYSQPRDRTQVTCNAGRFFTSWATREAQEYCSG